MATSTRTLVKRLYKRKPTITAPEMSEKLGLSRQRIHQLTTSMGITLAKAHRKPVVALGSCTLCGKKLDYPRTTSHARCHYVRVKCVGCGVFFKLTRANKKRSKTHYHDRDCFEQNGATGVKWHRARGAA